MPSTDTLPLDAPLLPPLILRPPLGPRMVRGMVMLLAFILLGLTAGWSVLMDGREGELAGAARMLVLGREPVETVSPSGPLTVWLCKGSMNLFGVNETAARLPSALAALAAIWLALRIGERCGGTWRGLVAGMLLLCTPGMFTLGRVLSSAPLEMAFVAAVFHALVCAYQERGTRRQWLLIAWVFGVCAWFSGGWTPVGTIALSVGVLMACYRTARIRFRGLFSWEAAVLLAGTAVCAWASGFRGVPSGLPLASLGQTFGWQGLLLFPWSLLLLPALWRLGQRLMQRRALEWEEGLPLIWLGCGAVVIALSPTRSLFDTMMLWPAFALWAARALEITSQRALLRGVGVVLVLGLGVLLVVGSFPKLAGGVFPPLHDSLAAIPALFWQSFASVIFLALLAFVLGLAAVFVLELYHHRRFAMVGLFGAMIPLGYACADIGSRFAPFFSHVEIARVANHLSLGQNGLTVDSSRYRASSLYFYLDSLYLPFQTASAECPDYLITRRGRLAYWEQRCGERTFQTEYEIAGLLLLRPAPKP